MSDEKQQARFNKMVAEMSQPSVSPQNDRILNAAVEIRQENDKQDIAYMARELVQCTLPHKDPGPDKLSWSRTSGSVSLGIVPGIDLKTETSIGFPYGSIPRLLLCWLNTEAVRTGNRKLDMGETFDGFMRKLGMDPRTGGGKRGDAARLKEQIRRLFASRISFQQKLTDGKRRGEFQLNMEVTSKSELWWDPQASGTIELGEAFFDSITASPVPSDLRAIKALKHSPLALDLYLWATHKVASANRRGKPIFVSWTQMQKQFGQEYAQMRQFKAKAIKRLKAIEQVFPALRLEDEQDGLNVRPGPTAIASRSNGLILPADKVILDEK